MSKVCAPSPCSTWRCSISALVFFRVGFASVDAFVVISGYLITCIILKEVAAGESTFAYFYERRVRCIFLALCAMLLAAPAMPLPSYLEWLSVTVTATVLFGSNILFWIQSGYSDLFVQLTSLLHTSSLEMEEQFYIGFFIRMLPALFCVITFALCLCYQRLIYLMEWFGDASRYHYAHDVSQMLYRNCFHRILACDN